MPNVRGYGKGDLHIQVQLLTPRKLNNEQRKLFEELSKFEEKELKSNDKIFNRVLKGLLQFLHLKPSISPFLYYEF